MNPAEAQRIKSCEYYILVPFELIGKLNTLLRDETKVSMGDLFSKYEENFGEILDHYITRSNEIVIQPKFFDNITPSKAPQKPKGWSGIDDLLRKLDFTDYLAEEVKEVSGRLVSDDRFHLYAHIKFFCEISESPTNKLTQTLEIYEKTVGKTEIPNFFDKVDWKYRQVYPGFVSNIYDPSKFWMRFAEVDRLQKMLLDFYSKRRNEFTLTPEVMDIGMYCAAFIDNEYHRARVVRVDIKEPNYLIVFLIDHGSIYQKHYSNLFKLHEKFAAFPAFAVRCILANVAPTDNENWTKEGVEKFTSLTSGEKKLGVRINNISPERKVLEVYLVDPTVERDGRCPTINHYLISKNLAKNMWHLSNQPPQGRLYKPLREFMYLYPIHEMIENGTAPSTWFLTEQLKKCVAWDWLFPEFYAYTKKKRDCV